MTIRAVFRSAFSRAFLGRFGERLCVGAPPGRLAAKKRNIAPTRRRADRGGILFHPLGAFFQFSRPRQIGLSQSSIGHCRAPCRADAPRQPNASSFSQEALPIPSTICVKSYRFAARRTMSSPMVDKG